MAAASRQSYCFTLTVREGFSVNQIASFADWLKLRTDYCFVSKELTAAGLWHIHAQANLVPKNTSNVTKAVKGWYKQEDLEVGPCSIKIKKETDRIGWFHYLTKDINSTDKPVLCHGYKWGEIQAECLANVKKIPRKMLEGDDYVLKMRTAYKVIMQYAQRIGQPITGKQSFMQILSKMICDGYLYHQLKLKIVLGHVMGCIGDEAAVFDMLENELHWV